MDYPTALNPHHSVVVEACAGSGKTWLLVSRIVRLLLDGVRPSDILAITFTRKTAQEMQVRLRDWLYELASQDDTFVRQFLRERAVDASKIESLLPKARGLYQQFLLAQPNITISTFHGWFIQLLQRAPVNAGVAGGTQLLEQTGPLRQEAWQTLLDELQRQPEHPAAVSMLWLFQQLGLHNTQALLFAQLDKRSDWFAFTHAQTEPVEFVLQQLRDELDIDTQHVPAEQLLHHPEFTDDVRHFCAQLNASAAQKRKSDQILAYLDGTSDAETFFQGLWNEFYTQKNTPRSIKPNKGQDSAAFLSALECVQLQLQQVFDQREALQIYRFNQHALICGQQLISHYQTLKQRQQALDFGDLEWRVYQLLNNSEHAEYMQFKLDSRYQHVLLDEFQDTNPLQWQILQAWFAAAAEVDSMPTVFVVGDPKQSIYRFRGADARLFTLVREFLQQRFQAAYLSQNTTRRNAPAILDCVNALFGQRSDYLGFETHHAFSEQPGWVACLPLCLPDEVDNRTEDDGLQLRNPLQQAAEETLDNAREQEAEQLAVQIETMVERWQINDEGRQRPVQYRDIMVLVRRRSYLSIYEQVLRRYRIPHLSSRRGGLLSTLEAQDLQALLSFLITPFADLQLAHTLRSPIFCCSDQQLMQLAQYQHQQQEKKLSLWQALQHCAAADTLLHYASERLQHWQKLAERLPVHDLLDHIYFSADLQQRYLDCAPPAMHAAIQANLQAFLEISLNIDAGRFPSLPGFLRALTELDQGDDNESPDEGKIAHSGDVVRIFTVHESKGLEAPIVYLIDANTTREPSDNYDVLLDWPAGESQPQHLSLYRSKKQAGVARQHYFEQQQQLAHRENLNLLYVAITRAKQALLVSGVGELKDESWYGRVQQTLDQENDDNPLQHPASVSSPAEEVPLDSITLDPRLQQPIPVGGRTPQLTDPQQYGIWLHALMEHISTGEIQHHEQPPYQLGIPTPQLPELWQHAQTLYHQPQLQRFFDPGQYLSACNELSYISENGELKRIDRLVEFDTEVWILDYKTGNDAVELHSQQLMEYRQAMTSLHPEKSVRCGIINGQGELREIV